MSLYCGVYFLGFPFGMSDRGLWGWRLYRYGIGRLWLGVGLNGIEDGRKRFLVSTLSSVFFHLLGFIFIPIQYMIS